MEGENKVETLDETTTTPVVETIEPVTEAPTTAPVVVETPSEPAPAETPAEPVTEAPAPVETPTEAPSEAPAAETNAPAPEEAPAPKKKSGGVLLILLILVLAFFAVWFFVLGGNEMLGLKKKAEEPNQEESQKQEGEDKEEESQPVELEYSLDEATELFESILPPYDLIDHKLDRFINDKKVNVLDLDEEEVFTNILESYYKDNDTIPVDEFDKKVSERFYSYSIEHKDHIGYCLGEKGYKYNETTNSYEVAPSWNQGGCGGACIYCGENPYKVLSAKVTGNDLKVIIGVFFRLPDEAEGTVNYYYDYAKTNKVEDGVINADNTDFDKAAKYELHFNKVNDTYAFVSAELVK